MAQTLRGPDGGSHSRGRTLQCYLKRDKQRERHRERENQRETE